MAKFDPTYKRYGIRATIERVIFVVYAVSTCSTIVPIWYFMVGTMLALYFGVPVSYHFLLIFGLMSSIIWFTLLYIGYRYLHFEQHENIFSTDEYLDFKKSEYLDKFISLKNVTEEIGDSDTYKKLSPIQRKIIKDAIEDLIQEVKNEDETSK